MTAYYVGILAALAITVAIAVALTQPPRRTVYSCWRLWHARLGYALFVLLLVIAVYFLFAQEWVGASLSVPLLAFVLWTLRRG